MLRGGPGFPHDIRIPGGIDTAGPGRTPPESLFIRMSGPFHEIQCNAPAAAAFPDVIPSDMRPGCPGGEPGSSPVPDWCERRVLPATPKVTRAPPAAAKKSCCTAQKAPVMALAAHPVPVTRPMRGLPLPMTTDRFPVCHESPQPRSQQRSKTGPAASSTAAERASATIPSAESTPLVAELPPAKAMISDALQRTTASSISLTKAPSGFRPETGCPRSYRIENDRDGLSVGRIAPP